MESANNERLDKLSDIQKFYENETIFVTGGTGFLGNILLEKLLRSCSGLKRIYVLLREKKGKDPKERFKEIFENELFDKMKVVCPDYLSKVSPIIGDCKKPNLGINENDRNIILSEVTVVFHVAATVRFDEHLREAVHINIRATGDLLDIAKSMKLLKAFVHVSTAYSNCVERQVVCEKFYEPPVSPENLIRATDAFSDEILERITLPLIKPWPNTYAFTKVIAEEVVRRKGAMLPIAVLRPAIVIATANEPLTGWINNFYGPTGVVAAAGLGLLRSIHADGNCIADVVPCDKVVNAIIATAWNIGKQKSEKIVETSVSDKEKTNNITAEIPIYNYVSSNANPITWREFMEYNEQGAPDIPSVLAIWVYCLTLNKYRFVHRIYCIFLHLLPALIVDSYAKLVGKEPRLWAAYEKIHKFSEVISYFSTKQWKFVDSNTRELVSRLSSKDREMFDFDLAKLNWKEYFYHHIRGLRVYLVHDKMDTVKAAIEKRKKLLIAHYTLKTLLWSLVLYVALSIIRIIF